MEKSFKITLADGTQLKNLKLNGNNYISKTEITEDYFKGKLSKIIFHNNQPIFHIEFSKFLTTFVKFLFLYKYTPSFSLI